MIENAKIKPTHLARNSVIYVRQSTAHQLEHNRESTDRQYRLVERALELGWRRDQIVVIDQDLGCTGSGAIERSGFEKMASDVALGRTGIIFGLEVSRLARNNSDWYRLLDLAGMTDTLIADADGIYHPGLFNDRLLLGLKGTMSEAELYLIRARMNGGIRNKAARGELRCPIPVGYVWADDKDAMNFHPNEAVISAIRNVFERFAEMGSVRQVWLWFQSQGLPFPIQSRRTGETSFVRATYWQIHEVLTNPVYAGIYAFGKSRQQRTIDSAGRIKTHVRNLPQEEWQVFIRDHHESFIDWQTYEKNQTRMRSNSRARPHEVGGAVRAGAALLQGLATCGRCGRRLNVYYQGRNSSPGYRCPGTILKDGKATWCLRVGGRQIEEAVVKEFLEAMNPAGIESALMAEASFDADHDAAVSQWRLEVERLRYEAQRAERRHRAVEPENRLVARGLEAEWEKCLLSLSVAETELATREKDRTRKLTFDEKERLNALAVDVRKVWSAPTTNDRDKKELLRTVLQEVNIKIAPASETASLSMRWCGGLITDIELELKRRRVPRLRTDEETVALVRRLAQYYSDPVIAGILNRQGRRTARGERFSAHRVHGLRSSWNIPKCESPKTEGELVSIDKAAEILGTATSTLHRFLAEGFIAGEQLTPGAPWRIRITEELRARFPDADVGGYMSMKKAKQLLRVTRQTIMQRIKRGELQAICIKRGKRKELRIKVPIETVSDGQQLKLFDGGS